MNLKLALEVILAFDKCFRPHKEVSYSISERGEEDTREVFINLPEETPFETIVNMAKVLNKFNLRVEIIWEKKQIKVHGFGNFDDKDIKKSISKHLDELELTDDEDDS